VPFASRDQRVLPAARQRRGLVNLTVSSFAVGHQA
jgi:hypothetical protein